jgi:hypothetical protein
VGLSRSGRRGGNYRPYRDSNSDPFAVLTAVTGTSRKQNSSVIASASFLSRLIITCTAHKYFPQYSFEVAGVCHICISNSMYIRTRSRKITLKNNKRLYLFKRNPCKLDRRCINICIKRIFISVNSLNKKYFKCCC